MIGAAILVGGVLLFWVASFIAGTVFGSIMTKTTPLPKRQTKFGACTATTQCPMRIKTQHTVQAIPERLCGVSDAIIADWIQWDQMNGGLTPTGRPLVKWAYCPWCGEPFTYQGVYTEAPPPVPPEEGEEWKAGSESP